MSAEMWYRCLLNSYLDDPTAQLKISWTCIESQPGSSSSPSILQPRKQALKTKSQGSPTPENEDMGSR